MPDPRILKMKEAHKVLARFPFDVIPLEKGYANRTLRVDLGKNEIAILPVDRKMKELWTGGKGFDLWMTFREINESTKWDSPENPICFSSGPLGGTTSFPGSGKTLVTAISPLTKSIIDCNVGGYFGPYLKFAGFDALMVTGKAAEDVIVFIDAVGGVVSIEKAPLESVDSHLAAEELTSMYAGSELDHRNIACVTAGRGAEHGRMGVLNFSFWDWRRGVARIKQAGRGGVGTVFRDKKIKALVLKSRQITPAWKIEESGAARLAAPKKLHRQDDPADLAAIGAIIDRWGCDPDYAIEMMQDLQDRFHYISSTALDEMARKTSAARAHLYHAATFFSEFSLEPRGETIVQVCMGTACHVKGAANVLGSFERVLGIKSGGTTSDGKYSLDAVACLGACSVAPVVKIGDSLFGNVQAKDVEKLLKEAGKAVPHDGPRCDGNLGGAVRLLAGDLEKMAADRVAAAGKFKRRLMVCGGSSCGSSNSAAIRDRLEAALEEKGLGGDTDIVTTGCNGFCSAGPVITIQPGGTFYRKVREKDVDAIVEGLAAGKPADKLLYTDPVTGKKLERMDDIPFFRMQEPVAMRNRGFVDPGRIEDYIARGGYGALKKALTSMSPDQVRAEIAASGLRGRGGGGFPTGLKWESAVRAAAESGSDVTVVCNGLERNIIDTDPHTVIEGMIIGAYATGAKKGYIFIRKEYPAAMERVVTALDQCRAFGILGKGILGSGFDFDIRIHRRTGSFVSGESSALLASMSGRAGEPRPKYVHGSESGLHDKPTVVNNVETWANVPVIVENGSGWFASTGTGIAGGDPMTGSAGTKVLSLSGDIRNTGLVEVPMGMTLREIVEDIGGGVPDGRALKAVQTGGPSGGVIPGSMLGTPYDFESIANAGSIVGSGSVLVLNDRKCMVDMARNFTSFLLGESCGKCTACREGLHHMRALLAAICDGRGSAGDIEKLEELAVTMKETSLCGFGATAANPVITTLKHFRREYEEHIRDGRCAGGVCRALVTYSIDPEKCTGCTLCALACPAEAITGEKKKTHVIDGGKCIKCGICFETCNFDAVEVK
jgi:NADH:ubiquinone oxidoreductase subunit F (NADH-binding)/NADH:ubiquinone oxidoreductase subunit E